MNSRRLHWKLLIDDIIADVNFFAFFDSFVTIFIDNNIFVDAMAVVGCIMYRY